MAHLRMDPRPPELDIAEPAQASGKLLRLPTWAVAHDLAGGVRGILQLCGLIDGQSERLPPQAAIQLQAIGRRARRMQRFIRDLQDLERPRRAPDDTGAVYPAAVVRAVVADLEPELAALRPRLYLGWLPPVAVSAEDLTRLLANLIGNALQHRALVKPRLEIAACHREGMIELAITDNGPGIPDEQRARVFEPFFRLPSARREAGSGLGLAICRAIVESYGGRIWVEPAPGGGSRFCCTLPPAG
jgi:signal transduction histidine kinase